MPSYTKTNVNKPGSKMTALSNYNQPYSFWGRNPTALITAKKMWADGVSAGAIALKLSTEYKERISRNAIIGKLVRTNGMAKRLTRTDNRHMQNRLHARRKVNKKQIQKAILNEQDIMPVLPVNGLNSLPYERPDTAVSLYDAKSNQCRWPVGYPHELLFCGAIIVPDSGLSYCPHHFRRATPRHREVINGSKPYYPFNR